MKRNSSPRRGRGRSQPPHPPRRKESTYRRLWICNIPFDCRPNELRARFEGFGPVKDVYIPRGHKSGISRGYGFLEFFDANDAREAQRSMHRRTFRGREISVDIALDLGKRPGEMNARELSGSRGRSHGGSSSRVISQLRSPRHPSDSRSRSRSRHREGNMKSSPPRRGNGDRGRNPPPPPPLREESTHRRLLVRNIPIDCRAEELRVRFKRFGPVKDVNIPSDYKSGISQGIAFVEFFDASDARKAQRSMHRETFGGREIAVRIALDPGKRPEDMQASRELSGSRGRSHGRSRSRSIPRLRSPRHPSDARSRYRSRSYSPGPRRRGADNSPSPRRRQEKRPKSRRPPRGHSRRSYSPDRDRNGAKNQATGSRRHGGRAV